MKNWKAVAPIVLSLLIAMGGSFFLYRWIKSRSAPAQIVKVEADAVPILVAAVDLSWGTKLSKEMVKKVAFLKESLPAGYFSDEAALRDRIVIAPIKQGEPLVEHRLAPIGITTGGVSAILPPGKRAIAVKGDKIIGISGFISPQNRVDVLATMTHPKTKAEMTKLVLENVLVLATGTVMEDNGKGEPKPVDVYTLEVTPEEGEKLALAATKGKLQFALRNVTDSENVLTKGATIDKTLASLSPVEPRKPRQRVIKKKTAPTKWEPAAYTVEVIKGNALTKEKMIMR